MTLVSRAALSVLALVALCRSTGAAQGRDTVRLPAIVVTATRVPAPREEVPNAVTVLEGAELERRGVTRVSEALREVPGLTVVQSGTPGAVTSLFLRGGEADYVRVLVDGVPANQPGGAINLADLTTENVERIEVVRGPVSTLYGSDAVSGVVHIITRRGGGQTRVHASVGATEQGSMLAASLAGRAGGVGYSLGGTRSEVPGVYRLNHRYRGWSASGLVRAAPDARSDLQLSLRHQDGVFHFPTDGSGAPVDSNQYTAGGVTVVGLDAGRFLSRRVEVRVLLGLTSAVDRAVNDPDSPGSEEYSYSVRTPWGRRGADGRVVWRMASRGTLVMGAAAESERFRGGGDTSAVRRGNRALYAQFTGPAAEAGLNVTAGARLEDNDRFGRFLTVRAGFTSRLAAGTTLRGGAGTAFKEPTFYENFGGGYGGGNPDLAPERSVSGELGIEQWLAGERLVVAATLFAQQFDSLIQYAPGGPVGSPWYHNLAGAFAGGLELELSARPWSGGRLRAGWTWLRTRVTNSGAGGGGFDDGEPLIRRPTHSGTLALEQHRGAFDAGLTLMYVGRRDDLDYGASFAGERRVMPGYVRVDARFAWWLGGGYSLTAQVQNALDERYAEVLGFPARRRTVWLGASYRRGD